MSAPRIVEFGGVRVVAGLTWTLKGGAKGAELPLKEKVAKLFATDDPLQLQWDDRISRSDQKSFAGLPSLAQAVTQKLPQNVNAGTVLVAVSRGDLHCAFVLAGGRPTVGAEDLFDSAEALIAACQDKLGHGDIQAIVASPDLLDALPGPVPKSPLSDGDVDQRGLAAFRKASAATPILMAVAAGVFVVGLGVHYIPTLLPKRAPSGPVVPVARMVPDWTAFAQDCTTAFEQRWPSIPGWTATAAGCTPAGLVGHAKAWKTFTLADGHNPTIAARVAQVIYAHWPSPVEVRGSAVTIGDPIPQSWIPAPAPVPPLSASDFQQLVAKTYVGVLKSVSARQGATGAAVSVTINAGFGDAFARFERLKGAQLLSIREENGMTTVVIAPAAPVLRPVQKPGTHPEKG